MKKQVMQRGLALSALMVLVITGNAMAMETLTADKVVSDGIWYHDGFVRNDKDWNLGSYELWLDNQINDSGAQHAVKATGYSFVGDAGSTLRIEPGAGKTITYGLAFYGTVNVPNVIINVDSNAVEALVGETNITSENMSLSSGGANGVSATEEGSVVINNSGKLSITAANHGIVSNLGGSNVSVTTNELEVTANTAKEGGSAIKADGGGNAVKVTATGKAVVNGDINAGANTSATLLLNTSDSVLNGAINGAGSTELGLSKGATWNVSSASSVGKLSGDEANITVNSLEQGLVSIGEKADETKLTVTTSSDNFTKGAESGLKDLSNVVVMADNTAAADKLVGTAGSIYDEVTAEVNDDGSLSNVKKTVAATNIDVSNMAALGLLSWRGEMNDMFKRLGELRDANGEEGVWMRMQRGEAKYDGIKNLYNQYQLGYDHKLGDSSWTLGMGLSYTDGENTFTKGNGKNTNRALAIYGSKLNDDGSFIDLIAKYARLKNDFHTYDGMGGGDYSTNGYSVSAEYGKKVEGNDGFWLEPQAELTYGKVSDTNYVTRKGVRVHQDGMDSLVGRLGLRVGKDIDQGNVYAKASYLYDFDGKTAVTLNGTEKLKQDIGGGWWELGLGTNINLSKVTYVYADVEKTYGGKVDTSWQWNLGVRYSF